MTLRRVVTLWRWMRFCSEMFVLSITMAVYNSGAFPLAKTLMAFWFVLHINHHWKPGRA